MNEGVIRGCEREPEETLRVQRVLGADRYAIATLRSQIVETDSCRAKKEWAAQYRRVAWLVRGTLVKHTKLIALDAKRGKGPRIYERQTEILVSARVGALATGLESLIAIHLGQDTEVGTELF